MPRLKENIKLEPKIACTDSFDRWAKFKRDTTIVEYIIYTYSAQNISSVSKNMKILRDVEKTLNKHVNNGLKFLSDFKR